MIKMNIETFLDKRMIKSKATRKNYTLNIQTYFKHLNKDINTYFNDDLTNEDYENDLRTVYDVVYENGRPLLSIRTFFNSIKQYMIANDKKLRDLEFWDILKARTKGAEPDNDEAILNQKDIKTIFSHGNTLSRAMFLMLASSGRRIGEILALEPEDVHTEETPAWINIKKTMGSKTTKTGQKTICYISNEAAQSYNEWIKEREFYLKTALKKSLKEKDENDTRVFPMSYGNAITIWETLLIRSKLVETEMVRNKWSGKMCRQIKRKNKGDRLLYHPHCLRKFFRSYLGDADFAEYLMGHSTMLTRAYRMMKPEDKAEKYLSLMQNVTFFGVGPDSERLTGLQEQLDEKDKQIKEMQDMMQEMKAQILELRLEKLEKANGIKK